MIFKKPNETEKTIIIILCSIAFGFFIGVLARLFTKLAFNLGDGWINGSGIWLGVICWGITFTTSFYIKPDLVSSKNFIRSWMVVIGIFLASSLVLVPAKVLAE